MNLNIVSLQHSSHNSVETVQKDAEQRLVEQQNLNGEFAKKFGYHFFGTNHISYIQGVFFFFIGPPPKSSKYKKVNLG